MEFQDFRISGFQDLGISGPGVDCPDTTAITPSRTRSIPNPQILKSSNLQIFKSSNPKIPKSQKILKS
jgi:hypothetical protein